MNRALHSHTRLTVVLAGILGLLTGSALAQPGTDLSHGVLILHHPSSCGYSREEGLSVCTYADLQDCASQDNDNLPLGTTAWCWFVIAAFLEESQWCGVEFGVEYVEQAPSLIEWGVCVPSNGLEIPGAGWPAPGTGTSVATTDVPWSGNFQAVYWFTGYSYYGPGVFQLIDHPGTPGEIAFANCAGEEFPADCFGAIGFGVPGIDCCPALPVLWACCLFDGICIMLEADVCLAAGGAWHEGLYCDDALECPVPVVCCVDHVCYFVHEQECAALGGTLHPEFVDCTGEPCEALTPAAPTSWGAIKATYQ